jgi:ABC-type uncharacterized transport system involved in gliding motility auxiliary subunit
MKKLTASPKVLIGVFVLMFVVILASSKFLAGVRWDLTENGLYTLSDGTKNILNKLDKPVTLTLYFSDKASSQLPALRTYAQRVEELLTEYVGLSEGKLTFNKVDPIPFSEAEDEASLAGLQGVPAGVRGDEIYFGLRVQNETGAEEVIPFMQPDREAFLEYELTRLISSLSKTSLPKVGIYSGVEIKGGFDYMTRQSRPAWTMIEYMQESFELEWLEDDATEITGVDVLLLFAPQNLSDSLLFAIDQFVLGGGRTLVFLDPYSEAFAAQGGMPSVQRADLETLLPGWGLKLREDMFLTDFTNSMVVGVGESRDPVRHIGLLSMNPQEAYPVSSEDGEMGVGSDIVLHGLESLNWSSAGILDLQEGASTKVRSLLVSSDQSMPQAAQLLTQLPDPQALMNDFVPSGERYILAAKISGKAKTAFPDGVTVTVSEDSISEDSSYDDPTAESDAEETSETSEKTITLKPGITEADNIHVLVVSDTDILSDRLWVQVQNFFGQQMVTPWADNGSFLVNALENFSGHPDLIEIRSQGRFNRPFDRVESLRLEAEERFLAQQELLEEELQATEGKLVELERLRGEGDGAMFSPEQADELEKFQVEKLKIRKQLRDVQHQLDQDIESLGASLKLINIFFVPILICFLVLVAGMRRRIA